MNFSCSSKCTEGCNNNCIEIDCGWGCLLECISCASTCLGKCVNSGCRNTCSDGSVDSDNAFGCDNDCYIGCSGECKGGCVEKKKERPKYRSLKSFYIKEFYFFSSESFILDSIGDGKRHKRSNNASSPLVSRYDILLLLDVCSSSSFTPLKEYIGTLRPQRCPNF